MTTKHISSYPEAGNRDKKEELTFWSPLKSAISETLFVALPLIVIAIVLAAQGNVLGILYQAEWAFGATVLSGQSITKIVLIISRAGTPNHKIANSILVISIIIVILLVPSLIVLALMLILNPVPLILVVLQIIFFILSLLMFFLLHLLAESFQGDQELHQALK